jgi:hypothetical protein
LDSDAHSSENEDISAQSTNDTTDTNFTQRADNTNCTTAPVVQMFIEGPSGLQQTEAPDINQYSSPWNVFMLFFFNFTTTGGRDKKILSPVPGHNGRRMVTTD